MHAFAQVRCRDLKRWALVVAPIAATLSVAFIPVASAHSAESASPALTSFHVGQNVVSLPARYTPGTVIPVVVTSTAPSPLAPLAPGRGLFGADDGSGYGIPTPPKSSGGHPIVAALGALVQQAGSATMGVGISGLIANGLASAGVVTLPATVPGAAVSGAVAAGGAVLFLVGYTINHLAQDPVDFDYTVVARPKRIKLIPLTTSNRTLKPIYAAQNALTATIVRSYELSAAFETSVNRAAGATIRNRNSWRVRQTTAALSYAHQVAPLLRMLPAQQRRLESSYRHAGIRGTISQQTIARSFATLKTAEGKRKLAGELKKLGLSSLYKTVYGGLAAATAPAYGVRFPGTIIDPNLLRSELDAANTVAGYNASTIQSIIARSK